MSAPSVVVIGAGSVGLVTALTLLHQGHTNISIYDALEKGRNGSRSTTVHTHTLEQLHTLSPQYASDLIDLGIKAQGVYACERQTQLVHLPFGQYIEGLTEFPYSLIVPQHTFEKYFEEQLAKLGVRVKRGEDMRLVGMKECDKEGQNELCFADGTTVKADYVIGADGSRSTVRKLAGISFMNPFTGEPYETPKGEVVSRSTSQGKSTQYLVLSDAILEGPIPENFSRVHLSGHLSPAGIMFIIPLPSRDLDSPDAHQRSRWRIVFAKNVPANASREALPPASPTIEYVQGCLDEACKVYKEKPRIATLETSSRYRPREAIAGTMFKRLGGCVLLVGDAAHVHSPVGGQGLNLGVCDAVCLGSTLVKHIKQQQTDISDKPKTNPDSLFERYSITRLQVAREVISLATTGFRVISAAMILPSVVRRFIAGVFNQLSFAKRKAVWRLSGLANKIYD